MGAGLSGGSVSRARPAERCGPLPIRSRVPWEHFGSASSRSKVHDATNVIEWFISARFGETHFHNESLRQSLAIFSRHFNPVMERTHG